VSQTGQTRLRGEGRRDMSCPASQHRPSYGKAPSGLARARKNRARLRPARPRDLRRVGDPEAVRRLRRTGRKRNVEHPNLRPGHGAGDPPDHQARARQYVSISVARSGRSVSYQDQRKRFAKLKPKPRRNRRTTIAKANKTIPAETPTIPVTLITRPTMISLSAIADLLHLIGGPSRSGYRH